MEYFLVIARISLALVFVVAGVTKALDLRNARKAMTDFGVPDRIATPLGTVLPFVEIAVGLLLFLPRTALLGARTGLLLLLLFAIAIAWNLIHGRSPECHCFGQLHSKPVTWLTVARNLILASIAGRVGFWPSKTTVHLDSALTSDIALTLAAFAVVASVIGGWFLWELLQQHGRILLRLEALEKHLPGLGYVPPLQTQPAPAIGLPIGSAAPRFEIPDLARNLTSLDQLLNPGKPVILLFIDPGCGPCTAMLPEVASWQRQYAEEFRTVVISRGFAKDNLAKIGNERIADVLLQNDREVANSYQCYGTPGAVVVTADGRIGSQVVPGAEEIRSLVRQVVDGTLPSLAPLPTPIQPGAGHAEPLLTIGEQVPQMKLPNLAGHTVNLSELHREGLVLLFWNPGCGFCSRMLPDLKVWEQSSSQGRTKLLLVSAGSVESNRAMGLRSTIVLDDSFQVGRMFGAGGTPSAVHIGGDGRISSSVVVGAPAVLGLLNNGNRS